MTSSCGCGTDRSAVRQDAGGGLCAHGQLRLRIRYEDRATPWFDYLLASPAEMREILTDTGWHVARVFRSKASTYTAVIEKQR